MKYSLVIGCATSLVLFVNHASAESPKEVQTIAKSVVVQIITGKGSGVIIHRQGDLYTLITNRHVVCGSGNCRENQLSTNYSLRTTDRQVYQVAKAGVKLLKDRAGNSLDLAIVQFRSDRSYPVAQVADPDSLQVDDVVYTAGFPNQLGFKFGTGKVIAAVKKRLSNDAGGYTVIYDSPTLPGMSGGGVFDRDGRLVAVHGQGDKYRKNTQIAVASPTGNLTARAKVGTKIGVNRGIPVHWLMQGINGLGISIDNQQFSRVARPIAAVTADEYLIAGFNKFVDPGEDAQGSHRDAVQQFSRAIALSPRYTIAYFLRALVYGQLQEYSQALVDYNRAISLNPQNALTFNNRGALKAEGLLDTPGALADYNQSIILDPKDANTYYNRGTLKYQSLNDAQGAIADYNQAIALDSELSSAYLNRGLVKYEKLNDPQGAMADFERAISLDPELSPAYLNRGVVKSEKLNDNIGALADFNRAISLNPKLALAYLDRGVLKDRKLNDNPGALADFNQAISLAPKLAPAYLNRGLLKYEKLNDPSGAMADYNQAISLDPKLALAYLNLGVVKYEKLSDIQGAMADYNQAISLDPQLALAFYNRAVLKAGKMNDFQGALADYNQTIFLWKRSASALDPKLAIVYNNRGALKYQQLNDPQGASTDYSQAISLNPTFADAYYNRGILKKNKLSDSPAERLHQRAGAIQDFQQAAKFYQQQGSEVGLKRASDQLRKLEATE